MQFAWNFRAFFSRKNEKNVINFSAEFAQRLLKVNEYWDERTIYLYGIFMRMGTPSYM